ncbi:nucleoside hydrolase [Pleomorphomonas sp. NRK KF1]|uniref:nucleoside hydrolase n=1 Tax=Pleomorphomonas sp. NRK KF1 TaxID=2943000 RepID=UPI00204465F8|nr:nucleoside hydrolase [Pleomorphomonas sp. NRK KF1]MCM5555352.1 nucleoside hydrolase [Pleomorphomonas sp. NRK KF1]
MNTSPTTRRRLIIDCDPGHDDFAAIALAVTSGAFEIEAITAVCGNAPLDCTSANALAIADALGTSIPVYAGAVAPLLHRYEFPAAFHGVTGLDSAGATLPPPRRALAPGHAAEEIVRRVNAAPGEITLVVLGPMTNLALAIALDPELPGKARELVFMGGGIVGGNVTPRAEFNLWADPEAAAMVLRSGIKATMFGLDVTNDAWIDRDDLARLRAAVPGANPVADIIQYYTERSGDIAAGRVPGPALHDTCPLAWLIDPTLFTIEQLPVTVDTVPGPHYGATDADRRSWVPEGGARIGVALGLDRPGVARLVTDALVDAARRIAQR